ncbi:hypothetical protein ACJX0J_038367, partial [Zea mays]
IFVHTHYAAFCFREIFLDWGAHESWQGLVTFLQRLGGQLFANHLFGSMPITTTTESPITHYTHQECAAAELGICSQNKKRKTDPLLKAVTVLFNLNNEKKIFGASMLIFYKKIQ